MMKRVLLISLALTLVMTALAPGMALAAKPEPFGAMGTITDLDEGTVFPAGNSGRWRVELREVEGETKLGSIQDSFTMTYKANVDSTQAGNLHGTLIFNTEPYVLKVNGKSESAVPLAVIEIATGVYLPTKLGIEINGHWTIIDGAHGTGDFTAWVVFEPEFIDGVMHVGPVIPLESFFSMHDGKWQP